VAFQDGIQTDISLPGGWNYPQTLNDGQVVTVTGMGYDALKREVLAFRLRHLDMVDPETATPEKVAKDLRSYVCGRWPNWCAEPNGTAPAFQPPVVPESAFVPLIARINHWFSAISGRSVGFVEPSDANRRAAICVDCPSNLRWETSCGPCVQQTRHASLVVKGSRKTLYEDDLLGCRAYGHLNPVAVWLTDTASVVLHPPPANCWKHNGR
jgi:hypothetical protein